MRNRKFAFVSFLVPIAVIWASTPLPLKKHSYRQLGLIPTWQKDLPFMPFCPQSFQLALCNQSIFVNNDSIEVNRLLGYLADSIGFEGIQINLRVRLDQKGHRANDLGWKDPDVLFGYDADRMVMDWKMNDIFSLKLGKDRLNWGPLKLGGLLLSDYNQGFVMVHQQYNLGPFLLKGMFTQLNSYPWTDNVENGPLVDTENRFFSASRLAYAKKRYGVAVGQSIVYAGPNRNFEIEYMLPFYIYHYGQMSNFRLGNSFEDTYGSVDFYAWILSDRLKAYGELLVDDVQGGLDSISRGVQNSIGFMAGIEWHWPGALDGFLESGQINSHVYNHAAGYRLRYQNKNAFIGSPLGPDQQMIWGEVGREMKPWWRLSGHFWIRRMGERNINYEYTFDDLHGTHDDPVPYGVVESEQIFWLKSSFLHWNVKAELEVGVLNYNNMGHVTGDNHAWPFFSLGLSTGVSFVPKQELK